MDISGKNQTNQFTYWYSFGLHFRYQNQFYDHSNQICVPTSLDRTRETKFWMYSNFAWYISTSEVNTYLASEHFKNGGVVQPGTGFWKDSEIEYIKNTIGV